MPASTYVKTPAGQEAFRTRDPAISFRQRKAFLLSDGQRSLAEVLADTAGLGVTSQDIQDLVDKGFLAMGAGGAPGPDPVAEAPPSPASGGAPVASAPPEASDAIDTVERYQKAYRIATQITASLGLRGFRLNLQVEAAAGYQGLLDLVPAIAKAAGDDAVRPLREALGIAR